MRAAFALAALVLSLPAATPEQEARTLWEAWPAARVSPADPWALKHAGLRAALDQLQIRHPALFTIAEEGTSSEGRKIPLLRVGEGPTPILLWSQMHGDEPSATSALLDLLNWMGSKPEDPTVRLLRSRLTLWIIPMLNPDGAERTQRRNAQNIDINRDALRLSTPEGRFLKAVRDRVRPVLGYNLHNQNPNLLAGKRGRQVAMSLLSVPGDEDDSPALGTARTKQLALRVDQLAEVFAPGRVSRYDMDYTARSFGDSMTRWGTPTLLIETGGWSRPEEAASLVRLNFVALAGSLSAIADGSLDRFDPADYARLPLNVRESVATLIVRNVRLASGRGLPPFVVDLGFLVQGSFAGDEPRGKAPSIMEVGDLAHALGLAEVDGTGLLALPWPEPAADWAALQASLAARGLEGASEATLLGALKAKGEAAVARPGFPGPVLLYRPGKDGLLHLEGAVLRGQPVGGLRAVATGGSR